MSTRVAFATSKRSNWKSGEVFPEDPPSLFHRQPLLVAPRTLDRAPGYAASRLVDVKTNVSLRLLRGT